MSFLSNYLYSDDKMGHAMLDVVIYLFFLLSFFCFCCLICLFREKVSYCHFGRCVCFFSNFTIHEYIDNGDERLQCNDSILETKQFTFSQLCVLVFFSVFFLLSSSFFWQAAFYVHLYFNSLTNQTVFRFFFLSWSVSFFFWFFNFCSIEFFGFHLIFYFFALANKMFICSWHISMNGFYWIVFGCD